MIGSGSRSETLSKKSTLRVCGIKIYVIKSLRQKKKKCHGGPYLQAPSGPGGVRKRNALQAETGLVNETPYRVEFLKPEWVFPGCDGAWLEHQNSMPESWKEVTERPQPPCQNDLFLVQKTIVSFQYSINLCSCSWLIRWFGLQMIP